MLGKAKAIEEIVFGVQKREEGRERDRRVFTAQKGGNIYRSFHYSFLVSWAGGWGEVASWYPPDVGFLNLGTLKQKSYVTSRGPMDNKRQYS